MMNYELFKNIAVSRIKHFLPIEFKDYAVELRTVRKVNQTLDCINLIPAEDDMMITPNVYINEMYKDFMECQDLNLVLHRAATVIYFAFKNMNPDMAKIDFSEWTNNIVINLINTEDNRELLDEVPHREVMDLSVIYRFIMGQEAGNLATVRINNSLMEEIHMTEEELFALAMKNTKRMFPAITEPLNKERLILKEGMAEGEYTQSGMSKDDISNSIHFITNSVHIHGATALLFEEDLFALAEKMKSSFYVLPSSVHEVVAIAEPMGEPRLLEMLLKDSNSQEVVGVEKLSDHIYFYNWANRTLSMAC